MESEKPKTLFRECEAIMIPSGERIVLPAGSRVWITQALGGSYTVTTDRGSMVRIAGRDADALGLETPGEHREPSVAGKGPADVEKLVWDELKGCFDPEIPVNIVELGLVYQCRVIPLEKGGHKVEVRFTLTAPGCGMGEVLKTDIKNKISALPGIREVDVELVWDPPWNQSMMSQEAKIELGMV